MSEIKLNKFKESIVEILTGPTSGTTAERLANTMLSNPDKAKELAYTLIKIGEDYLNGYP